MAFVFLALVFIVLKFLDLGFMATVSWWWLAVPLVAAALWWEFADKVGYTQKKAMDRLDAKKEERRRRTLESLGRGDANRKH